MRILTKGLKVAGLDVTNMHDHSSVQHGVIYVSEMLPRVHTFMSL